MSILKKLGKGLKKVGKVAGKVSMASQAIANPAAYAMQVSMSGAGVRQQLGRYGDQGMTMSMMNPPRLGMGSARTLSKVGTRLPGPVGKTIGGLVVIGGWLYDQLGNRVGKAPGHRTRAKGITATQLKAFTRVTHILDKYCKVKPPGGARRTTHRASRSKTCR